MTRSLMIFGQGAIRCHPYVLKEMQALLEADYGKRLKDFDRALFGHIGFGFSNAVRAFVLGLTHAKIGAAPGDAYTRRYYRKLNRYSAALALVADVSMGVLGGKLKFKEKLSARLGDVLSHLYIASAMLKRYEDSGRPEADRPLLAWAFHDSVWHMQMALDGVIRNFPVRPVAWLLRALVFPFGRREVPPSDRLGHRVAALLMSPNEARTRLLEWAFITPTGEQSGGPHERAAAGRDRRRAGRAQVPQGGQGRPGHRARIRRPAAARPSRPAPSARPSATLLQQVHEATAEFINVDDFDPSELVAAKVRPGKDGKKNGKGKRAA